MKYATYVRQAGRQTDGQTSASIQVDVTGNPPPAPQLILVNVPNQNCSNKFEVCKSVHHHTFQINQPTRCNNFSSFIT